MSRFTVPIDGLHCQGCVTTVTNTIGAMPGVSSVSVNLNTRGVSEVTVDAASDISDQAIAEAIASEGNFSIAR